MKFFLKSILFFLIPIFVIGMTMEIYLRSIPNDYSFKDEYIKYNAKDIKTLVLGSSHSFRGINPIYLGEDAFNLSHIAQTLDYDYLLFEKNKENFESLKNIIIPISYFSYFNELKEGKESWRIKNYEIYYDINSNFAIKYKFETLANRFQLNLKRIYSNLNGSDAITTDSLGYGAFEKLQLKDINWENNGKEAASRHTKINDLHLKKHLNYLTSIIKYGEANNINVILISLPVYKTYLDNVNSLQYNRTIGLSDSIANAYSNLIYLNEFENSNFEQEDFYNSDHLNKKGAEKISLKISKFTK